MKTDYLESIECRHSTIEENFCIECGLEIERNIFVNEYSDKPTVILKHNRGSIYYKDRAIIPFVIKILTSINHLSLKNEVLYQLKIKKFINRISINNKILLIVYHLLKKSDFPISVNDLLVFSNLKKHKFLKIFRNSFNYISKSENYYLNIFRRAKKFIEKTFYISSQIEFLSFHNNITMSISSDSFLYCVIFLLLDIRVKTKPIKEFLRRHKGLYDTIKKQISKYS